MPISEPGFFSKRVSSVVSCGTGVSGVSVAGWLGAACIMLCSRAAQLGPQCLPIQGMLGTSSFTEEKCSVKQGADIAEGWAGGYRQEQGNNIKSDDGC